jgi:hypothetical protein
MVSSLSSLGRSLFAAALAGAAVISMGCSSNTAVEDTRSQELASEEDAACVSASVGDGSTCIDYVDLKTNLHTLCEADGRVLVDLSNLVECPNGDGVVQADYVCCAPTPPDPNQDPGPSSDGCIYEVLGDGTTCELASTLEAQATAICDAAGLLVNGFGTSNDCPNGGATYAKVACCPEGGPINSDPGPPPDPVVCTYHALGDGSACASDAAWAAEAQSICSAEGLPVTDLYLAADCADGTSSFGKLACCEP